jgi:serine/threonine protein kinase
MPTDSPPASRPETLGPYRIQETIREGGAASVYRATDPASGRDVALKLYAPEVIGNAVAIARFEREVATAGSLRHPNVLAVVGSGRADDRLYIVTELFDGQSLERALVGRRITPAQAVEIAKQICIGLTYTHSRGVVHGHLSPRHILVSSDFSQVKLADFGLSEIEALAAFDGTLQTGAFNLQSFHYMAPEQSGERGRGGSPAALTPQVDIFATGVMLQEMLTGKLAGPRVALPSHVDPQVPSIADVIVLRCMSRDPAARYRSAAELLAQLEQLQEALRVRLLSHLRGLSQWFKGRTVVVSGLVLLVVIAVVATILALR